MNSEDKRIMDMLIQDKNKKYRVIVDNDCICVEDIDKEENIHTFENFGYELIFQLFQYLNINVEMC